MSVDTLTPTTESVHKEILERLRKADEEPKPLAHFVRQWRWLGIPEDELVELQLIAPTAPDERLADELRKRNRLDSRLGEFRPANRYARAEGLKEALGLLRHAAENHQAQGLYLIPSKLKPAVAAKAARNTWLQAAQGSGTTDNDIERRRVLMFDVDPMRAGGVKDISASPDERNRAVSRAIDLYGDLACVLGNDSAFRAHGERALALVSSGNGAQVQLRVDLDAATETTALVQRLLRVLNALYSTATEEIDTAVSDPKRLFPAAGTLKRKGLNDEASGRVHRIITFVAGYDVPTVLGLDEVRGLLETLESRLTAEQRAKLDPKKTPTTTTKPKSDRSSARQADWDAFWSSVEAVSVADVMAWLGIEGTCPGCGSTSGADDLTEKKGVPVWKCLHNRCAQKGDGKGTFNTRHLVIEARRQEVEDRTRDRGKEPGNPKDLMTTAAMMIAEQFAIEIPKRGGRRDPKPLIEALNEGAAIDSDEMLDVLHAIAGLDTAIERDAQVEQLKTKLGLKATQVRSVVSTIGTMRRAAKASKPDDEPEASDHEPFVRGDHVEIAERLQERHPGMVFTEGAFWQFNDASWREVTHSTLSVEVQSMAGTRVGDGGRLAIKHSGISGSIACLSARVDEPEFFVSRPGLVSFSNGMLRVSSEGSIELLPHSAEHRCRFGYSFAWDLEAVSKRMLNACGQWFRGDSDKTEKTKALLEHLGLTILGYAPSYARAAVYYGPSAGNGKSTAAAIFRACIPAGFVSSLSPQQLGEKFSIAELAGMRANIMDDLPSKAVMDAEILKVAITGKNPVKAERKNQRPFSFVPEAGWLVCGNTLPRSDDPTEGYFRRWLVITFSRVFKSGDGGDEKRDFESFVLEERAQIVSMAIRVAAQALARGGYTIPSSHETIMSSWRDGEPVRGFVASLCERVSVGTGDTREKLYEAFRDWSAKNGFGAMSANTFSQRLENVGLRKHTERGTVFLVRLRRPDVKDHDAENDEIAREVIDPAWTLYEVVQDERDELWARRHDDPKGRLYALTDDEPAIRRLWDRRVEREGRVTYPPVRGLVGIGTGGRPTLRGWSVVDEAQAS